MARVKHDETQEDRSQRGSRTPKETLDRYRDAAETLFIRLGYEGTSIRAISARTGMNLATVVYHWGTKRALFEDLLRRRFGPICAIQATRLRDMARLDEPPSLSDVLSALVEPPLLTPQSDRAAMWIGLLYGRALTDPSAEIADIITALFSEASALMLELMSRCLPDLPEDELMRRYTCAVGAFIFAQGFSHRIAQATNVRVPLVPRRVRATEIVAFMQAGLTHGR